MSSWDPQQYSRFADERARPFHELVARIPTQSAVAVVDLGCGPGTMTATLAARYPDAAVLGIDSSPDMIAAAEALATPQLRFQLGDIGAYQPSRGSIDVIVANASLQWVGDHATLLPVLAAALDSGGTLAFQVPTVGVEPIEQVASSPRWAPLLSSALSGTGPRSSSPVLSASEYIGILAGAGLSVDAWETTYHHVLPGEDPVLEWFSGTGLRPYFDALSGTDLADFRAEMAAALREAYPRHPFGTVLPFPRLFVVAHRP
ncbi:methyltransferase domain-containing protein [Dactylosporangium sp. AC04546]|uniref:methyltransferase domain-containing protein n=1 Tax=Dactylosporangium sp. AC04546 TaxID=2862460 RepID=UPI001EE0B5EB|nr:methyltransferase domain-containing protein [Dactylosporangium sp. AC04546]WVK84931.1 methyltransferase domain-containing protein [Dactylosporangium sp. AC04546]